MIRVLVVNVMVICLTLTNGVGMATAGKVKKNTDTLVVRSFDSLFEPSAIVSLADGNVMIFEDEGDDVVSVYRLVEDKDGMLLQKVETPLPSFEVSDVEGAAIGRKEGVVAITSHSKNKKGKRRDKREQLVYLGPVSKTEPIAVSGRELKEKIIQHLTSIDSTLAKGSPDLNIEGISFTPDGKRLLIGLREPVYKGKAIIVELTNPYELLFKESSPQLSRQLKLLDLGGAGVRAMTYEKAAGLYFVVSEVKTKKGKMRSRLWNWKKDEGVTVRMTFSGLKKLKNIEGITSLQYKNRRFLLFVCDDGNKKKKQGASYALIDIDQVEAHR